MKRKILYLILPIFFFFFNVNIALADDSVSCAVQQEKIDKYNSYKDQLASIDCTKTNDETTVMMCNNVNTQTNILITELMKLNDEGDICSDKQEEVNKIIEENEGKCGKIFDDSFSDFVNGLFSLDFAKATVSAEQDALKKAWKNFSKRLVATLLLFLTPTIVNIIISFNVSDKYLSGNAYSCDFDYLVYTKEYNIRYVPKTNSSTTSIVAGDIVSAADALFKKYYEDEWVYSLNSTNSGLFYNDIDSSTNKASRTCCATFVGSVLYLSGVFTEQEINSYGYNSAPATYEFLKSKGWTEVSYENLQPGDVVFTDWESDGLDGNIDHTQIFAGTSDNGEYLWYTAGYTGAWKDHKGEPYSQGNIRVNYVAGLRK